MDKTDEQLMKDYARNDNLQSFEILYHRYAGKVFGYLMKRLKDRNQSEEIHQNVFLKLHQARNQYQDHHNFAPWFFTIVRSTMLDSLRRSKVHSGRLQDLDAGEYENIADPKHEDSPENDKPDLESLKKKLNKEERKEIELRYEKDWSFEKIAQELGLTEVSVRKRISRAIRKLRKSV